MKNKDVFFFAFMCCPLLGFGCAGPISPFGGVDVWSGDGQIFLVHSTEMPASEFSMSPKRQVLHKASDLRIEFNPGSQKRINPLIKVTYNKKEVTSTFLKSAKMRKVQKDVQKETEQQIQYVFNKLNLKPDRRHQIDVYWSADNGASFSHLTYLPPNCSINGARDIATTKPFKPKREYINTINSVATLQQLNPSLLAGLIAQESGFNPTQVSRAKALGLTQVTSIADEEIRKLRPEWQTDPRIEKLSVREIENLITREEISRHQDWRLDPKQAIEGGALYLNYLMTYWNLPENKTLLSQTPKTETSEVILASYNSGAARVKSKMKNRGEDWLDDDELKEAFKYVNSVISYCYHFSEN